MFDFLTFELSENRFFACLEGLLFFMAILCSVILLHHNLKPQEVRKVPEKKKPSRR